MRNFLENIPYKFIIIYLVLSIIGIAFVIYTLNDFYFNKKIILVIIALIGSSLALIQYNQDKNLYKTALIIILIFGILFVFLSPIENIPDENEHFIRSELISEGVLFPDYVNESGHTGF